MEEEHTEEVEPSVLTSKIHCVPLERGCSHTTRSKNLERCPRSEEKSCEHYAAVQPLLEKGASFFVGMPSWIWASFSYAGRLRPNPSHILAGDPAGSWPKGWVGTRVSPAEQTSGAPAEATRPGRRVCRKPAKPTWTLAFRFVFGAGGFRRSAPGSRFFSSLHSGSWAVSRLREPTPTRCVSLRLWNFGVNAASGPGGRAPWRT